MEYTKEQKRDIIEWDVVNWWKFIEFINNSGVSFEGKKILDIGGRNGGVSLYCALQGGAEVVCSDYDGPTPEAHELHKKYGVDNRIRYEKIDATNIPDKYNGYFDIVVMKSVIGSVGGYGRKEKESTMVGNIHKVLKPGGTLLFSENMKATKLHHFLRRFNNWSGWDYQSPRSIKELFKDFNCVRSEFYGFTACFGRNERWRVILGNLDSLIERFLPSSWRYIGAYEYKKEPDINI